ncbi:hypothetical protein H0H87_009683 [Tephrocybe sp. NHM501043]|nr:hypothetical protein H0H87_009683 [Tephrocybe sp. NHM501043]
MSVNAQPAAPAWQTDELQEEWVEFDEENGDNDDDDNLTYGTRSISLTAPLATHIYTTSHEDSASLSRSRSPLAVGTFLVREDIPNEPLLAKTPGKQKKGVIKDFFSPLPLERMFEPPSPPPKSKLSNSLIPPSNAYQPSPLSSGEESPKGEEEDEIVETDMPDMNSFHGRKASIACQFTFAVPRNRMLTPKAMNEGAAQAQSTPNPPFIPNRTAPPTTDPRLRLFQFQYDTYTREQLSAMVDSIAVNSGTGTTPSPISFNHLSQVLETDSSVENMSHLRSAKRIKLSPSSDYGEGAGHGAVIGRPRILGKDYVGESKSLMQQIKQARDFSTISTVASSRQGSPPIAQDDPRSSGGRGRFSLFFFDAVCIMMNGFLEPTGPPSLLDVPAGKAEDSSHGGSYIVSNYRQQAAALMAQIKSDMKGQKRLFSGDTETSYGTLQDDDKFNSFSSNADILSAHAQPGDKENRRELRTSSTRSTKSNPSKHKASPRRPRRVQADADVLVDEVARLSIHGRRSFSDNSLHSSQPSSTRRTSSSRTVSLSSRPPSTVSTAPSSLAPPSHPSSSLRNEDLNRFVSSSTASGTTLTAGSAPSFVKHAGPAHIRTIAPTDMPPVPEVYKGMLFDKVMMKWVKNTAKATQEQSGVTPPEELSEDPFGDIESLRDDSRREADYDVSDRQPHAAEMSRIEEQSEVDDEEELEMNSFSTDDPSAAHIVDVMTGVETFDDDATTDSEDETEQGGLGEFPGFRYDELQESMSMSSPPLGAHPTLPPHEPMVTPHRNNLQLATTTPVIRSALKSGTATPASVLKSNMQTPLHRGHRRSVSFSDGKREGPIQGLGESTTTDGDGHETGTDILEGSSSGVVQSARSKRIAEMMDALVDDDDDDEESPTKAGSLNRGEIQAVAALRHGSGALSPAESSRRMFSRSRSQRQSVMAAERSSRNLNANATFLTECSFAVSHGRLVEVITDVEPFTPHWDKLASIDLSEKKLESVARLKEFLPRLDALSFTCRRFAELACLRHLRQLKADGNKITSLEGLERMDGLVKLSVQGNSIRMVDLNQYRCTGVLRARLEVLNISQNKLDRILGLASLQALVVLNLDNNEIGDLEVDGAMPQLRVLRASGNRLHQLRVAQLGNLRTLYADNNSLTSLVKVERLTKLENLSLRNQSGRGLNLLTRDVRDVKRLYLSGNPLNAGFLSEPCYNLHYLEVAACRLTRLPENMARVVPNLRALNLNYNFLEDVRGLEGLTRLRKLTIIGSRLGSTKALIRVLEGMPDVEMADFRCVDGAGRGENIVLMALCRMNPCTLGWYVPLLVQNAAGALEPREGGSGMDRRFRRDLPDKEYLGRLAYRGLIMGGCRGIRVLDGVEVTEKERAKAHQLLMIEGGRISVGR